MLATIRYMIGSAGPSGYGSRSTADEVTGACPDLRSTTAIITGGTSGIGMETARALAKRGARLVLPARNLKAAEETRAQIASEFEGSEITVLPLDLSSLSSVRGFVDRFLSLNLPLNLLINNAGKFCYDHQVSEDGVEMTYATNYLGHFLLTKLLLNEMVQTARKTGIAGRIVKVSSSFHRWFSGDGIQYIDLVAKGKIPCDGGRVYALSKLAIVLHTRELSKTLQEIDANVTVNCLHPGTVRTRLNREREGLVTGVVFFLASKFLKTIPQATATTCYLAAHPKVACVSGKYFSDCDEASPAMAASSDEEALHLWTASESLVAKYCPSKGAPCDYVGAL